MYSNKKDLEFISGIKDQIDFIELLVIHDFNETDEVVKRLIDIGLPVQIHIANSNHGINLANRKKHETNRLAMEKAIHVADMLGSEVIVVHPNDSNDDEIDVGYFLDFIKGFDDARIHIENLRFTPHSISSTIDDLAYLIENTGYSFCFDFEHCIVSYFAHVQETDYISFCRDYITKLKPKYFHISDGRLGNIKDIHLRIGKGEFDIKSMVRLIPENSSIVIETPHDEHQIEDIRWIKDATHYK